MFLEMTIISLHLSSSVHIYVLWRHLYSMTPYIYVPSFNRKRQSGPLVRVAHFLTFDSMGSTHVFGIYAISSMHSSAAFLLVQSMCVLLLLRLHSNTVQFPNKSFYYYSSLWALTYHVQQWPTSTS